MELSINSYQLRGWLGYSVGSLNNCTLVLRSVPSTQLDIF